MPITRRQRTAVVVIAGDDRTSDRGARALADTLSDIGIDIVYLGREASASRIAESVVRAEADAVEVCIGGRHGGPLLRDLLRELDRVDRRYVSIVVHKVQWRDHAKAPSFVGWEEAELILGLKVSLPRKAVMLRATTPATYPCTQLFLGIRGATCGGGADRALTDGAPGRGCGFPAVTVTDRSPEWPLGERRVLARLVERSSGRGRGVFELADGRRVELEGVIDFDAVDAPSPGEKAFVVTDASGQALRWEPYPGARLRRRRPESGWRRSVRWRESITPAPTQLFRGERPVAPRIRVELALLFGREWLDTWPPAPGSSPRREYV
jgi:methylmalonyl-CoA mutase cobalamin-binding domain/chain